MAAHAWWRILVTANHGNPYTSIAEVEMRGAPGGSDLCEGGTAVSSPFYSDGGDWICTAAKAFDNDSTTPQSLWHSRDAWTLPVWLGYQFAAPVDIVEVAITFRTTWQSQSNTGQSIRDFTMQWSDDGVAWNDQISFATLAVWGYSETRVFSLATPQPHPVGSVTRHAPAAVPGAPTKHVLHNATHCSPGSNAGMPSWNLLDNVVCNTPSPNEGPSPIRHAEVPSSRMRDFWGYGRVEGTVTIEGAPAARKVRLFDALTGLLIAETWSRRDGHYRFDFLDPSRDYFVLAHDYVRQFNAVIADWIKPEPTVYP
jgi:hypothetical protein